MNAPLDQQKYPVLIEGFVLQTFRKVGETVEMNPRQAREFIREGRLGEPEARAKKKQAATEPSK